MNNVVPTQLSFEKIRDIGSNEGKNSQVILALDIQLNSELIIKIIPKADFKNIDQYYKEARILYKIDHPNIMKLNYASEDKDNIYFSMPYLKNGSISSIMNKCTIPERDVVVYSLQFLSGLHYIHVNKLIHFDIKPTNILLSNSNKAILTDFGLSNYMNNVGLSKQEYVYMPHVAPERLRTNLLSQASDIYQTGLTMYRMCNGNQLFREQLSLYRNQNEFTNAVLNGKFPNRKGYLPTVSLKLRRIINKALEVNVDKRYKTVIDLLNDLSRLTY